MADQQESGSAGEGAVDPGQGQLASAPPNDQPTSVDASAVADALLQNEKFTELLERQAQSQKDRRFAKQEKQMTSFQEQMERMQSLMTDQGLSQEQAMDRMSLEDRLNVLEGQGNIPSEPQSPPSDEASTADVDAVLKAVGIDPNSPQVTDFYKAGDITPNKILDFVVKAKTPARTPSPAQAVPAPSGQMPQADLMAQYKEDMSNEALTRSQRLELRHKYRKEGLNI